MNTPVVDFGGAAAGVTAALNAEPVLLFIVIAAVIVAVPLFIVAKAVGVTRLEDKKR